jgi:hypothetical protein
VHRNTVEQCGVVRFLWAKGMTAKDIHKEMVPMYGDHCLSREVVHIWDQKFSEGGGAKYRRKTSGLQKEYKYPVAVKENCI